MKKEVSLHLHELYINGRFVEIGLNCMPHEESIKLEENSTALRDEFQKTLTQEQLDMYRAIDNYWSEVGFYDGEKAFCDALRLMELLKLSKEEVIKHLFVLYINEKFAEIGLDCTPHDKTIELDKNIEKLRNLFQSSLTQEQLDMYLDIDDYWSNVHLYDGEKSFCDALRLMSQLAL